MNTQNVIEKIEKIKRELDQLKELVGDTSVVEENFGTTGTFDGKYMVTEDNRKFEVSANYAVKSKLVYGDTLKMTQKDDRNYFKQISKVKRKRIEGILNKKEGEWHFLADSGSYKVSAVAVEFCSAQLNDEAIAYIPEDNLHAPFAALERVVGGKDVTSFDFNNEGKPKEKPEKSNNLGNPASLKDNNKSKKSENKFEKNKSENKASKPLENQPQKKSQPNDLAIVNEPIDKDDKDNKGKDEMREKNPDSQAISSVRSLTDEDLR